MSPPPPPVGVGAKPCPGLHQVIVYHPQRAKVAAAVVPVVCRQYRQGKGTRKKKVQGTPAGACRRCRPPPSRHLEVRTTEPCTQTLAGEGEVESALKPPGGFADVQGAAGDQVHGGSHWGASASAGFQPAAARQRKDEEGVGSKMSWVRDGLRAHSLQQRNAHAKKNRNEQPRNQERTVHSHVEELFWKRAPMGG